MTKLTNEIVDKRLLDRNIPIERIDNYSYSNIAIKFQCLREECGYIWLARPANIFSGKGCPKCAGVLRLSNEDIDQKLNNRKIKRIGDYITATIKITFQCLVENCGNVWVATPNKIFSQKSGCPKCAGHEKLSNEIIDDRLESRNIKRLENYLTAKTNIKFQCLVEDCRFIWSASPDNIVNGKRGCPKCAGKLKFTNDIVDQKLQYRSVKRIGNYINKLTKIDFQCLNCNRIWASTPNSIIDNESGCPVCSLGKNEKLIGTVFENNNVSFERHKRIDKIINGEKRRIFVDFYFVETNTIIEYNGAQHYKPICFGGLNLEIANSNFEKQQERDIYLNNFCLSNNIRIIWIDGRKYTNLKLEDYIINVVMPEICKEK